MDLTVYDIIQSLVVTEKASNLMSKDNKKRIVLKVHPKANKPMIKQAVKKLFNIEVSTVRIIVRKGKKRTFKRVVSHGALVKRAIVTLKPGYSLENVSSNVIPENK